MKRITLFILAIVMITVNVSANTYDDSSVSGNPYVEEAINSGVITTGDLDNLKDKITREKACEIIVDVLKSELPDVTPEIKFDDTDNQAVEYLYSLGIISGKGSNKFCPDDFITREEMAKIAVNTYIIMHPDYVEEEYNIIYPDESETSTWALEYVQKACGLKVMGIVERAEFPCFYPYFQIPKEEAIEIAFRLYNMREVDGTIAIPDEKTALEIGKTLLEKYSGKQMEYETDTGVYYLRVYYRKEIDAWSISQNYKYKNSSGGGGGSGILIPYVILNKSTGGLMFINTISDYDYCLR